MEGLHTWRQVNKTALTERLFRKNTAQQRISGRNQNAVEAMLRKLRRDTSICRLVCV